MILFDIRTDDSHAGFIAAVNRGLDSEPDQTYLSRFGYVASPRSWACFDRGEIPVDLLAGEVTHVGTRMDWCDELEDVIEFTSSSRASMVDPLEQGGGTNTPHRVGASHPNDVAGGIIVYDRSGPWATHPIRVGDRIQVACTEVELCTPAGPIQYQVDLRAEWFSSADERSLP